MKRLFYLAFILSALQACSSRTPIIDGETPFVVGKIIRYSDTHSEYFAIDSDSGKFRHSLQNLPSIVLPSGMYQINDTITSHFVEPQIVIN